MKLLALDLGRSLGWCLGDSGVIPASGSLLLRKRDDANALAVGALGRWLRDCVRQKGKPDMIIVEHWMSPKAQKAVAIIEDSLRLNGAVHAIAGVYGIPVAEPYPATVRSQVCGKPYAEGESARTGRKMSNTKWLVIDAMVFRGYLPKGCEDDDRADASALWCWGEANYAKVAPERFVLT